MAGKRATQADVARLAGVSRAAVSLVLNAASSSRVPISPETKQRVLRAAREIGYTTNSVARMLARGENLLIGVFVYLREFPIEREDFVYNYLLGIERAAQAANRNLVLFTGSTKNGNRHIYGDGQNCLSLAAGAVLLGGEPDRAELCRLTQEGYPFVYVGRREVAGCQIDWVTNDYKAGCYDATRHVLGLGHRRIGIIGLSLHLESHVDRLAGCRQAAAEVSGCELLMLDETQELCDGRLVQTLRSQNITALLCHDAGTVEAVTPVLAEAGVRVPQDLSLVWLTAADHTRSVMQNPTRVHFDRAAVGEAAVHMLIARLKGECESPQQVLFPCSFVPGTTTAPPR